MGLFLYEHGTSKGFKCASSKSDRFFMMAENKSFKCSNGCEIEKGSIMLFFNFKGFPFLRSYWNSKGMNE